MPPLVTASTVYPPAPSVVMVNSASTPLPPLTVPVTPVKVAAPVDVPEFTLTVETGLLFSKGFTTSAGLSVVLDNRLCLSKLTPAFVVPVKEKTPSVDPSRVSPPIDATVITKSFAGVKPPNCVPNIVMVSLTA